MSAVEALVARLSADCLARLCGKPFIAQDSAPSSPEDHSYARVVASISDLDARLAAITATGIDADRVFADKLSGLATIARPGLATMLDYARGGDTVMVTAADELGRSVAEVTSTMAELDARRMPLRASREGIDTAIPSARAVAAIMATSPNWFFEFWRAIADRRAAKRRRVRMVSAAISSR